MSNLIEMSSSALFIPLCPPEMILVSTIRKILDVWRKFKEFDLAIEDFYLPGSYHPIFVKIGG